MAMASSTTDSTGTTFATNPEPFRIGSRHRFREQGQLGGLGRPDQPGQEPRRAAVRHGSPIRPKAGAKLAPSAAIRRSQASARDTRTGRDPVHGTHDRLVQGAIARMIGL